jgi:hypothetical protein
MQIYSNQQRLVDKTPHMQQNVFTQKALQGMGKPMQTHTKNYEF